MKSATFWKAIISSPRTARLGLPNPNPNCWICQSNRSSLREGTEFCGLLIICVLLTVSLNAPAFSHHQLGLPHYLYSEDYPQIPTMVIDADAEGYDITFSMYPGNPKPGDTVRVSVYIKHRMTGKVYDKPIQISVSRERFLSGEGEFIAPRSVSPAFNKYKISYQFDEPEKYLINVTFEPRGDFFEKIAFPIVIGKTNFSIIPIVFGLVFLVTFALVGFTKKKRHTKRQELRNERTQNNQLSVLIKFSFCARLLPK